MSAIVSSFGFIEPFSMRVILSRVRLVASASASCENNSLSGSMLMGIAKIVVAYGDSLKEDVFKDHVGKLSVKAIARTAKERRPGALGYSEAMMLAYNAKNKYRLSLRALYGEKVSSPEEEVE